LYIYVVSALFYLRTCFNTLARKQSNTHGSLFFLFFRSLGKLFVLFSVYMHPVPPPTVTLDEAEGGLIELEDTEVVTVKDEVYTVADEPAKERVYLKLV
jgi:hypothetical protein